MNTHEETTTSEYLFWNHIIELFGVETMKNIQQQSKEKNVQLDMSEKALEKAHYGIYISPKIKHKVVLLDINGQDINYS